MKANFHNITLDDKKIFDKYEATTRQYYGGEYSFPFIFIYALDKMQICDLGDTAFIKTMWSGNRVYFPPLLKDASKLPQAIQFIEQQSQLEGVPLDIRGFTKDQTDTLDPRKYSSTINRGLSDYVYNAYDLINLSGKNFHSKRNFITRFYKAYDYTFRVYDESTDRAAIFNLLKKWDVNTRHEKWEIEETLITRAIDYYRELDLKIAVLYVGTELVAFSINSVRNAEIAYTLFEKADTDYIGSYQVINQRTAQMFFTNVKYVNRECDMNVDGLRKAKLSYNPIMIIDKYRVQHNN